MDVTYVSACSDSSGYAEAARNNIAALNKVGVNVSVEPISFEGRKADLGKLGNLIKRLQKVPSTGSIRIIHLTPHNYPRFIQKDKYNIGYAAWETDSLPEGWKEKINKLNEIWVPSQHNVEVFKNSGVTIPVFRVPHTFDVNQKVKNNVVVENKKGDFVFYSIFQWLERKNPADLIRAYLTEFQQDEKVVLALKTFIQHSDDNVETSHIRKKIANIKKTLYLKSYPRMLLISSLLSRDQILSFHSECDCYVTLHKCEGFGIPITEAMLAENPIVATGYGGPPDFIQHKETGYLVDYQLTPVCHMPWDFYTGKMTWASPDVMQARKYMREVFEDQKKAKAMGKKGKKWVQDNLSWNTIGKHMKARLEQIEKEL